MPNSVVPHCLNFALVHAICIQTLQHLECGTHWAAYNKQWPLLHKSLLHVDVAAMGYQNPIICRCYNLAQQQKQILDYALFSLQDLSPSQTTTLLTHVLVRCQQCNVIILFQSSGITLMSLYIDLFWFTK